MNSVTNFITKQIIKLFDISNLSDDKNGGEGGRQRDRETERGREREREGEGERDRQTEGDREYPSSVHRTSGDELRQRIRLAVV